MWIPYAGKGQAVAKPRRATLRTLAMLWLAGIAGVSAPTFAAPGEPGLPARNLVIEWRLNGGTQTQRHQAGIRSGQILVDSRGQIIGRSGIGAGRLETESRQASVQQVQVINGGRARLFVGETQPHLVWQWAWVDATLPPTGAGGRGSLGVIGPHGGSNGGPDGGPDRVSSEAPRQPRLAAQTVWLDVGQGLYVRPRWPGGRAPVLVDLEAMASEPVTAGGVRASRIEPDGQTRRIEVGSTLSVPLNEWTVVARSGSRVEQRQSGTLSTRELDGTESEQLEIRITAP